VKYRQLKCLFSASFAEKLVLFIMVKEFSKLVKTWQSYHWMINTNWSVPIQEVSTSKN